MALQVPHLREGSHAVATGEPARPSPWQRPLLPPAPPCLAERRRLGAGERGVGGGVSQLVAAQVAGLVVGDGAEAAGERPLAGVGAHVSLHVALGGEGVPALPTDEGAVARVDQQVALEVVGLGEARGADVAGVGPLPRVDQLVLLHVAGGHEGHRAHRAAVGAVA